MPWVCKEEVTQGNHLVTLGSALGEQQQPQKLSDQWRNVEESPGLSPFPPTHPLAEPVLGTKHLLTASHKKRETLACLSPTIFCTWGFAGTLNASQRHKKGYRPQPLLQHKLVLPAVPSEDVQPRPA